jgi:hypothetical protein
MQTTQSIHTSTDSAPRYIADYTVDWPNFDMQQFKRDGFSVIRGFSNPKEPG